MENGIRKASFSLSRVDTGGNPKSSKNAHAVGQPKTSKNVNGSGSFAVGLDMLKDKWEHGKLDQNGLNNIVRFIVGELKDKRLDTGGVETFLTDKDGKIDDCVRWYLLLCAIDAESIAVKKDDKRANEARLQLVETLISGRPYLAFGNINDRKKACVGGGWHGELKDKRTPLHLAIDEGNSRAVRIMIERGRETCDLTNIMKMKDLVFKRNPLGVAVNVDVVDVEIIHALLAVTDIGSARQSFEEALREGRYRVVEAFLQKTEVAMNMMTNGVVAKALEDLKTTVKGGHGSEEQSGDPKIAVAKLMVESLEPSEFDRKVVELIIQIGSMDLWKVRDETKLRDDLKNCLLHLAVRNQHYGFVEQFVKNHSSSTTNRWAYSDRTGKQFPLWYNNHDHNGAKIKGSPDTDRERIRERIRDRITNEMIQNESEMGNLFDMFHSCEEPVGDLCFDLSRFDSAGFEVSAFIDSMISQSQTGRLVRFEQTLRYAEFPPLDAPKDKREGFKDSCHLQYEHDEVFRILDWLKKTMKVKTIIKLKVPDRLVNSHDEDKMASAVEDFKVQIFDWKALDLCLGTLRPASKQRITELHLYSSGKRSVISHWFSKEGIPSMKQETCTSDHLWKLGHYIEVRLKELKDTKTIESLFDTKVDQISWYPKAQQANLMRIAQRVDPKLGRWLESLANYYQHGFQHGFKDDDDGFSPTKVAILDNGVLSVSPTSTTAGTIGSGGHLDANGKSKGGTSSHKQSATAATSLPRKLEDNNSLSSRIKEGRSFVAGRSSHSPWHLACNPHGTQMANLICAMDPLCDIYIARVSEDAVGITPDRVKKAIEWAIDMDVDVISMSFTIGEVGSLGDAIDKATKAGIVMTCSTHDEGSKTEAAWPASFKGDSNTLIVLAACDEYGRTLRNIDKNAYDYLIPGQNVSTGNIPFLKSKDKISGSSVATALAAGICSLTLTCDRMANSNRSYEKGRGPGSRYDRVKKELEKMKSKVGSEPVVLRKFGEIDQASLGGNPRAQEILDKFKRK